MKKKNGYVVAPNNALIITDAHKRIVSLLAAGKRPKEIGEVMELSNRTIEAKIDQIRVAAGCQTPAQLVAKFIREKIIE